MRLLAPLAMLTALLMVTVGCTQGPSVGARQPSTTATAANPQGSPPPMSAERAQRLAAQKQAAGIADCPVSDRSVPAAAAGLPDLVLTCLGGGREVRLAGLRGRPMLVNVWAQWCGPCREEAPYLAEVAKENSGDLMILGVDYVDPQPDLAIEFAQLSGWSYPQLADTDKALAAPLQILGPPVSFFVRADGTIAGRHSGAFRSAGQIRSLARQHLGVDL